MGYLDNPAQGELRDLLRRVRQLETGSPLGNSSITRGALRIASPEGLIVEGSEKVTGTLTISGILNGDGTFDWTGPVTFTGATNLDGPIEVNGASHFVGLATVDGNMDVNGTLNVDGPAGINGPTFLRGNTELTGDLTVDGGGRIILGTIVLNPTGGPGGSGLISSGTSIQVNAPTLAAQHDIFAGGNVTANGSVVVGGITGKGGVVANVYVDGSGKLFRVI